MRRPVRVFAASLLALLPRAAQAQSDVEDRLREAVRRTTVELRALQDNQAAMQATLDQAQQQRDALRKQVDELTARLAAAPAPEAPKPASAGPQASPSDASALAEARALREQNAALQAGLKRTQAAYEQAAQAARGKDSESQATRRTAEAAQSRLGACKAANGKLMTVANDILHVYQTQDFRNLILGSYEPLLGLKKVELQNTVQDYEDRIRDQQFFDPGAAAAGQPTAVPAPGSPKPPAR